MWAIIFLGILIRLININQSFWLDEAIGAIAVKNFTYKEIINTFMLADNHPPLYYLLLKAWSDLWGYSELSLRSLSILFSVIAIIYAFKIAELVYKNKQVSYFTIVFLTFSQFFVYYSQEARMYMPAAGIVAFTIYQFLKILDKKAQTINWIAFSIGLVGLFFIDYVPVFIYPAFLIIAFLHKNNLIWWKKFAASHVLLFILGLFWLPNFIIQTQNSPYTLQAMPGWKDVAGGATFKQLALLWMKFSSGRITFINKSIYYSYALIASLPFLYALFNAIKIKKSRDLVIFILFPTISLFAASVFFPGFIYFRLTFVYPIFAILVSAGLFSGHKKHMIVAISILFIQINSLFIYFFDENQQREQWRQVVEYIESTVQPDDLILFEYPQPFSPFRWYESGEFNTEGAFMRINATSEGTPERINELISDKSTIYQFEYLGDLSDPKKILEENLIENEFKIVSENANFVGVGKIIKWQR